MDEIQRTNILGVGVSAINLPLCLRMLDKWIDNNESNYVTVTGVHGVIESHYNENIRRIHNSAGMVTPDGMPLVWLSRLKGHKIVNRVYGPDLMLAVCEHSLEKEYKHFFYGGANGTLDLLVDKLIKRFPGLHVCGTYSPPFRTMSPDEDNELMNKINQTKPDILWVGLGTPKQELWMAAHLELVDVPVLIGVGAAFDFLAGAKMQAPRWMQRSGLEWVFRLFSEPQRLWKRYLINNPLFVILIIGQALGVKQYALDI